MKLSTIVRLFANETKRMISSSPWFYPNISISTK